MGEGARTRRFQPAPFGNASLLRSCLAGLVLALVLAGCGERPGPGQEDLCRRLIPIFNVEGAAFDIAAVQPVDRGAGVRLSYYATPPGDERRYRTLACTFTGARYATLDRGQLTHLRVDEQPLDPIRLYLLRHHFLAELDLSEVESRRFGDGVDLPVLPLALAAPFQHVLAGLPRASAYALIAAAFALAYGALGHLFVPLGALVALGGLAAMIGLAGLEGPLGSSGARQTAIAVILLSVPAAAWHGLVAGAVVSTAERRGGSRTGSVIASLAGAIVIVECVRLSAGRFTWTPPLPADPIPLARSGDLVVSATLPALASLAAAVTVLALIAAAMRWSHFGRNWRACRDDRRAAALCGVDIRLTVLAAVFAASSLAGLSGAILTLSFGGIGSDAALALGIKGLVGAAAGGLHSVTGAFAGGLALGLIEAVASSMLPLAGADAATYAMILLVVMWGPGGLLGRQQAAH